MYIHYLHQFNSLFKLPIHHSQNIPKEILSVIPVKWRLVLMSDGSFTKTLNNLTGHQINIEISQKSNYRINNYAINIRVIWLINQHNHKLAFARSVCILTKNYTQNLNTYKNKPIGQLFIEQQTDLYKNVEEIYYGQCYYLENQFNSNKKIWGRKYTAYYSHCSYITIQEFFSPHLTSFF